MHERICGTVLVNRLNLCFSSSQTLLKFFKSYTFPVYFGVGRAHAYKPYNFFEQFHEMYIYIYILVYVSDAHKHTPCPSVGNTSRQLTFSLGLYLSWCPPRPWCFLLKCSLDTGIWASEALEQKIKRWKMLFVRSMFQSDSRGQCNQTHISQSTLYLW